MFDAVARGHIAMVWFKRLFPRPIRAVDSKYSLVHSIMQIIWLIARLIENDIRRWVGLFRFHQDSEFTWIQTGMLNSFVASRISIWIIILFMKILISTFFFSIIILSSKIFLSSKIHHLCLWEKSHDEFFLKKNRELNEKEKLSYIFQIRWTFKKTQKICILVVKGLKNLLLFQRTHSWTRTSTIESGRWSTFVYFPFPRFLFFSFFFFLIFTETTHSS